MNGEFLVAAPSRAGTLRSRGAKRYAVATFFAAASAIGSFSQAPASFAGAFSLVCSASRQGVAMITRRSASNRETAFIDPGVGAIDTLVAHLRPEVEPIL